MKPAKNSVAISELAQSAVCEQLTVLCARYGAAKSEVQQAASDRGQAEHDRFHRQVTEHHDRKGRCFIATSACGQAHPTTRRLRAFRDQRLRRTRWGRRFVATYYRLSPPIARYLDRHPRPRALVARALGWLAARLGAAA